MNPYKPGPSLGRPSIPAGEDPMMDFRARLVHQQAEAAERRRMDLAEQCSRLKTAEERDPVRRGTHSRGNAAARPGASPAGNHRGQYRACRCRCARRTVSSRDTWRAQLRSSTRPGFKFNRSN